MTKHITVSDPEGNHIDYTMLESVEDVGTVFTFAPDVDLINCIEEGKIVLINGMGGYCFLVEDYHTIVS